MSISKTLRDEIALKARRLPDREWDKYLDSLVAEPEISGSIELTAIQAISLRYFFAAHALGGAMVNAHGMGTLSAEERAKHWAGAAELMYEAADAMIAAGGAK